MKKKLIYPERADFESFLRNHTSMETANQFGMSRATVNRLITKWNIPSVYERHQYPNELNKLQLDVITGNMLGDGSLSYIKPKRDVNSHFALVQKDSRIDYVTYIHDLLSPLSGEIRITKSPCPKMVDKKIIHNPDKFCYSCYFHTIRSPVFTRLRSKWYAESHMPKSRKVVPRDLKLNWRIVAIWMCDDGCNMNRCIKLSTESFAKDDVDFLIGRMSELGIVSHPQHRCDNKYTIYIGAKSYDYFIDSIKPHITFPSMSYKVER